MAACLLRYGAPRAACLRHRRQLTSSLSASLRGPPCVFHEAYSAPQLPAGHRFPMPVFAAIHQRLLRTGVVQPEQVVKPPDRVDRETLELVHCPAYVNDVLSGTLAPLALRRMGLPWSESLRERTLAEVAGTLATAELALKHGLACNTAGGTHHAARAHGSGYCLLNDLAIAAASLLSRGLLSRVMVVDCDVHQGDGTASMLADEPRAFTLSVHCADNFPATKQRSSLDVSLPAGTGDDAYLEALAGSLPAALQAFRPQLVLYDAGVDVHASDGLGRLELSDEGLLRRERYVLATCLAAGAAVAGVVGGGYDRDLEALAARHCFLHRAAQEAWTSFRLG